MKPITRIQRAFWAEAALYAYSDEKEAPGYRLYDAKETVLIDLVSDLMHLAHVEDMDFDRCLRLARMHFEAEADEDGASA